MNDAAIARPVSASGLLPTHSDKNVPLPLTPERSVAGFSGSVVGCSSHLSALIMDSAKRSGENAGIKSAGSRGRKEGFTDKRRIRGKRPEGEKEGTS